VWVKKVLARTLPEAMAQVKAELGPEAVILHTNQVKVGGLFGLFGTRMIEVTAAAEHAESRPPAPPAQVPAPVQRPPTVPVSPTPVVGRGSPGPMPVTALPVLTREGQTPSGLAAVKSEMATMKAMMGEVLEKMSAPAAGAPPEPELRVVYEALRSGGLEDEAALSVVNRVRARDLRGRLTLPEAKQLARELLLGDLSAVETVQVSTGACRIVALVGPTGVGKTTTLAKLAAHYSLGRHMRVALITADTYRIAAVEQLRTYSDILGIPLEVVYEPAEVGVAVARHRSRDLILVDTAGRSPRNEEHMRELQTYLRALSPDEVYLVVSLTSGYRDVTGIVGSYLPLGFQRFLFTKWDEVERPGLIYNVVQKYRLPLSYITNGQNVPDDIEVANPEKITRAIVGD